MLHIDLRRLSGALLYYLIAESKELAKYVYDKLCKRLTIQNPFGSQS